MTPITRTTKATPPLTAKQAAEMAGVSRDTIYRACRQRGFVARRIDGVWLISRVSFARWMEER